tara:strand:- start:63 stop:377 length:315 start_codon:yes stop_codon:yes gene_type:complete
MDQGEITMSDMKLIMENWDQFINEMELAPAIYDKLKAAGKLPPGATRKGGDQPQALDPEVLPLEIKDKLQSAGLEAGVATMIASALKKANPAVLQAIYKRLLKK